MIRKIRTSTFAMHFLTLFTGTLVAQLISFLVYPVLTRLYTAEDFGILTLFTSAVALFSVIASLRYEFAIVLPSEEKDARHLMHLSLLLTLGMTVLSLLTMLFLGNTLVKVFNAAALAPFIFFIPLAVLFTGAYQVFNYWSTRQRTFGLNARARVTQSAVIALVSVGMGLAGLAVMGLITGFLAGQILAALVLGWTLLKQLPAWLYDMSRSGMLSNLKRYRSFALVNSPHALVDSLQHNGTIFLVSFAFSNAILGWYAIAFRVLKAPVGLIGSAIGQVFFERASVMSRDGQNLRPLMWRIHRNMILLALPVFIPLMIFAPDLFAFLFSEAFREAGMIARALIPWIFVNFLLSPFSNLPIIYNLQKQALIIGLVDLALRTVSLLVGWYHEDYLLGFILMSAASTLLSIFVLLWYYQITRGNAVNAYT